MCLCGAEGSGVNLLWEIIIRPPRPLSPSETSWGVVGEPGAHLRQLLESKSRRELTFGTSPAPPSPCEGPRYKVYVVASYLLCVSYGPQPGYLCTYGASDHVVMARASLSRVRIHHLALLFFPPSIRVQVICCARYGPGLVR